MFCSSFHSSEENRRTKFCSRLLFWGAMMDVLTTKMFNLFNPLRTCSPSEAWVLFEEQNRGQAIYWRFVTEMMLGPGWAKIESLSVISWLENSHKILVQIKSNTAHFKCFMLHSCWENNPWSEIFTLIFTQKMTHKYSYFRLDKRKEKEIKKARVLLNSELRSSVFRHTVDNCCSVQWVSTEFSFLVVLVIWDAGLCCILSPRGSRGIPLEPRRGWAVRGCY